MSRHCLYISELPIEIPCWYCGQPCARFHQDQVLYASLVKDESYSMRWEYHCFNHEELEVEVTCVRHEVPPPNWFFNRIAVIHKNLRLHWNFYSGDRASLDVRKGSKSCWESISLRQWPPKFQTYPADFLVNSSPEKLLSFFKLYRVWS